MSQKTLTLNDYCEFIVDCLHKTAPIEFNETGYYSIRTPDIGRGRLILEKANRVSKETYEKWTIRAVPQAGDLILAREAPVGNVGIVQENMKVCCGQRTVHIRPDNTKIHSGYLVYLMIGDEIQGIIKGQSQGATVAHLNMEDIRALVLPELPSFPIQRKIADVLSAYDDLIEVNTRRIRILERMAQSVYREWFGKADGISLPEGWDIKTLGDVADVNSTSITRGNEPKEINYVDIASVSTGKIDVIQPMKFADAPGRARRIVQNGDVIWSTVRPNRKSYSLIINPPENMIVSTGFAVLRAKTVPFSYLYLATTTDEFAGYLTNHATGSAYPAVNSSDFANAEIILPPTELLNRFDEIATPMFILRENLLAKNANLRRTRDLLLPRLVSGEVAVEAVESKEELHC